MVSVIRTVTLYVQNFHRWLTNTPAVNCGCLSQGCQRLSPQGRPNQIKCICKLGNISRKHEPVSPLLRDLHWLPVPQRIEFKLVVLTYRCLHSMALPYLADELHRVADIDSRRRQRRHLSYRRRTTPPSATAHFRPRLRVYGTACHLASPRRRHCQPSGAVSRPFSWCFGLDNVWNFCSMFYSDCVLFYCKVFLQS